MSSPGRVILLSGCEEHLGWVAIVSCSVVSFGSLFLNWKQYSGVQPCFSRALFQLFCRYTLACGMHGDGARCTV